MPKVSPRKGKRRTIVDTKARRRGRDTLDVFNILAEDVGVRGFEGWFSIPWRDGRNAMAMVVELHKKVSTKLSMALPMYIDWTFPDVYWRCEELADSSVREDVSTTVQTLATMRLRMLQLYVSNSHGGGHGYNAILKHRWHKLDLSMLPDTGAGIVLAARSRDALQDNREVRRVAAFSEAWRAGLFRAAYALGTP